MAIQITKRPVGRPRKQKPTKTISFRFEEDLYAWAVSQKGGISLNQFINDIIRKEAGL